MVVTSSLRLADWMDLESVDSELTNRPYREWDWFEPLDDIDFYDEEPFDRCSHCGRRGSNPCPDCFVEVAAIERAHLTDGDVLDELDLY